MAKDMAKKKKDFSDTIQKTMGTNIPDPEKIGDQPGRPRGEMAGTRITGARDIPVEKIKPDPNQPRKEFDQEALAELAASIKRHGVMQAISVEYVEKEDYFQIISGERRYRASIMAELTSMPCIIHKVADRDRLARQIVENIQREDLSPIEKARGLLELKAQLGAETTWAQVEEQTGLSERRRKQFIALLNLPEDMQIEIVSLGSKPARNQITEKHARALLYLRNHPDKQLSLFEQIKDGTETISGDDAMRIAKGLISIGDPDRQRLVIIYSTTEDLRDQLRTKLAEIEAEKN